jgi:HD-GYP domain-containing protein (c-di-GMP phosphodiesterase class II)
MTVPLHERVPIQEVRDLITLGVVLPFSVFDALERLLLNEGQTIGSERQLDLLIERGAWVDRKLVDQCRQAADSAGAGTVRPTVERVVTLFDRWERALWDLDAVLRGTLKGEAKAAGWSTMVDELLALVDRDADIALFMAVRQDDRRFALYPLAHALHTAVLALLTARQAGWPVERQRAVVGAALSMNVAMLELQALMAEQDTPPTQRQLEVIRAHPLEGVRRLQAAGIADFAWLRAVAEHHERGDGSGYPRGLAEVGDEARVLRMADVYMAKITPRAQRPALAPLLASRQLFQQEPGSPLAMALIKAIGVHPPGCLVQLKSGEVAIVKQRQPGRPSPLVCTLSDRKGQPSVHSQLLDTAEPAHAITGPCADARPFARVPGERVYGIVPP